MRWFMVTVKRIGNKIFSNFKMGPNSCVIPHVTRTRNWNKNDILSGQCGEMHGPRGSQRELSLQCYSGLLTTLKWFSRRFQVKWDGQTGMWPPTWIGQTMRARETPCVSLDASSALRLEAPANHTCIIIKDENDHHCPWSDLVEF